MNGCCHHCGRRKCSCVTKSYAQFYGNCPVAATSICLGYQIGDNVTIRYNADTIYSNESCDKATALARELAQYEANSYIQCQNKCYGILCVDSFYTDPDFHFPGEQPQAQISTVNGFFNFETDADVNYTFTVIKACPEDGSLYNFVSYDAEGNLVELANIENVVGATVTITGPELAANATILLNIIFGNNHQLISLFNEFGETFIYPGVPCNYNLSNFVAGQSSPCLTLPCGLVVPDPTDPIPL